MLVVLLLARLMAPAQGRGACSERACPLPPRRNCSCEGRPEREAMRGARLASKRAARRWRMSLCCRRGAAAAVRRGAVVGRRLMPHCLVQQRDRSCWCGRLGGTATRGSAGATCA